MPASTATTLPSAGQQQVPPPAFHVMLKPRGAICNLRCHGAPRQPGGDRGAEHD